MKEIPDELWERIVGFLHAVDDGEMHYMDGDVYSDAETLLVDISKLEENRGR